MDYELQLDEYGRTTFASNGVAQTCYALNDAGGATNETWATDNAIGNATVAAFNFATNIYTANNLNQYTSILCDSQMLAHPSGSATPNLPSEAITNQLPTSLRTRVGNPFPPCRESRHPV